MIRYIKKINTLSGVAIVSVAHFFHDISSSFLPPILPLLVEEMQLSYTLAGALTVFVRLPSILNPLIGHFVEKFDLKFFVIITPLITSLAMSFIGISPLYGVLVILLLLAGISSSFFHVPTPVLIKRMSKKNVGTAMSFFMVGGELARTLGPIIAMSVVSIWGLKGTLILLPFGFFTSLFLYFKLRDFTEGNNKRNNNSKIKESIRSIWKLKRLFTVVFGVIVIKAFTASVIVAYLPLYLVKKGNSMFLSGSSLSIIAISAVVGVSLTGPISDKLGRKKTLLILGFLSPLVMNLFLFTKGWAMIPMLVLLGIVAFSTSPVLMALVQEEGHKIPAISSGVYMTINFLLSSVVVLFAGIFCDSVGISYGLYICSFLAILGLPFILFLPKGT